MLSQRFPAVLFLLSLLAGSFLGQAQGAGKPKPRVILVGVNGMEMDVIRPLILKGDLPNLARVIKNGVHGKLRTVDAPNCPRGLLDHVHQYAAGRARRYWLCGRRNHRQHEHVEAGTLLVRSFEEWSYRRHG